jgi:hypothetical protein
VLGGGPQDLTEVIWLRHKGRDKNPLSLFGVSGIEGVKGTHNRNREAAKHEMPFQVKVLVM